MREIMKKAISHVTIIGKGRFVKTGDTTTFYYDDALVAVRLRNRVVLSDTMTAQAREFVKLWGDV